MPRAISVRDERRDRAAAEPDLARRGRDQAEQGLEQRRLARAVGAEQAQHLALRDRDVDAAATIVAP